MDIKTLRIITWDGQSFDTDRYELIGSIEKRLGRTVNTPARMGDYPVFVELGSKNNLNIPAA